MADQTITQTTTNIPSYIKPYVETLLGKSEALANTAYTPYSGQRIAGLSGLQQTAMQDATNMAPSAYTQTAGGIAGAAATNAANVGYDPYQTGQFTGQAASQYMNPFMQNVVDIQQREAQRTADIAGTQRGAQAVKAGAFGGSRQGVMDAEAARNLAMQKGDIQAQGLNQAFNQAQQQFNTEQQLGEQSRQYGSGLGMQGLQTALQGAGQLGVLGQQQFGQQMDVNQLQAQYGGQQQGLAQAQMDLNYGDFQRQQQYPYQQLGFLSDMYRGLPMANTTQSMYATPPSMLSQLAGLGTTAAGIYGMTRAEGGTVKSYAKGGIAGLNPMELDAATDRMSGQQMQQAMGLASISDLARLQIDQKLKEQAMIRQAAANAQATQQMQPQSTIAQEQMAAMGIGGLDVSDDIVSAAGGGIIAFAEGGYEGRSDLRLDASQADSETNLENQRRMREEKADADAKTMQQTSPTAGGLGSLNAMIAERKQSGGDYESILKAVEAQGAQQINALSDYRAQVLKDQEAMGLRGKEQEAVLKEKQKSLEGDEKDNFNMALITAGLAMMGGTSSNALKNISEGALQGVGDYKKGKTKLQERAERYEDTLATLYDKQFSDKQVDAKELRAIDQEVVKARGAAKKELLSAEIEGFKITEAMADTILNTKADMLKAQMTVNASADPTDEMVRRINALDAAGKPKEAQAMREQLAANQRAKYAGYGAGVSRAVSGDPAVEAAQEQLSLASMMGNPFKIAAAEKGLENAMQLARERTGASGSAGGSAGSGGSSRMVFDAQGNLIQ